MSRPTTHTQRIWSAKNATATAELDKEFRLCQSKIVELTLAGFSGTVDFQSKLEPDGAYANCLYREIDVDPEGSDGVAQLSFTLITGVKRYLLIGARPHSQIVMTRSAGTISAIVYGHEE